MRRKQLVYPFVPKSANWLLPGHFWALPLYDGTFGCGRVIEIPGPENDLGRNQFLAGVIDWHGTELPTAESIAGAHCFNQGVARIHAITLTGGAVLGWRSLQDDCIEPWTFRGAEFCGNSWVHKGCTPSRPQTPDDDDLPILGYWFTNYATAIAEVRFGIESPN